MLLPALLLMLVLVLLSRLSRPEHDR